MSEYLIARVQYFADQISLNIVNIERDLFETEKDHEERKKLCTKLELYNELLKKFDGIFLEVIYRDRED